jgi:radical SAM protein with 4Fe4S-binding SPASM domain
MTSGKTYTAHRALPEFDLWDKMKKRKAVMSLDIELTARCNLNCRHCYINRPAGDREAKAHELTAAEITAIGGEAAGLGAVWCLVTGGEPLLRPDFFEIYLGLRKKGLLLSLYTNATLVSEEHIKFFKKYPPRDIEITVYGVTKETYERVTRVPGSFAAFERGLERLLASGIEVRLKAMALRSNLHEIPRIAEFCRARTKDYFRFDPFLHLRFDRDPARNREIEAERLTPEEVVALERGDAERFHSLETHCDEFIVPEFGESGCRHLFRCGAGKRNFVIGHDGNFKLCVSLLHPECLYDLRRGSLTDAWTRFVPEVLDRKTARPDYLERCAKCPIVNLCLWCPAHAYLETGELDAPIDNFCQIAHARASVLKKG